jgi:hypothetical protein
MVLLRSASLLQQSSDERCQTPLASKMIVKPEVEQTMSVSSRPRRLALASSCFVGRVTPLGDLLVLIRCRYGPLISMSSR